MPLSEWVTLRDLHDDVERILKNAPRMHALCCNFYVDKEEEGEEGEAAALRALQAAIGAKITILAYCSARIEKGLSELTSTKKDA